MEIRLKRRPILGITGAMVALVALTGSVMAADVCQRWLRGRQPQRRGVRHPGPAGSACTRRLDGYLGRGRRGSATTGSPPTAPGASTWRATSPARSARPSRRPIDDTYVVAVHARRAIPTRGPTVKTLDRRGRPATRRRSQLYLRHDGHDTVDAMGWVGRGLLVQGEGHRVTTLTFTNTTANSPFGPALDNVVVSETPQRPARTARTAAGRPWSTRPAPRSRTRATASASTRRAARPRSAATTNARGQLSRSSRHSKAHHHGPRLFQQAGAVSYSSARPRQGDVSNHALRPRKATARGALISDRATTSGEWPRREPTGPSRWSVDRLPPPPAPARYCPRPCWQLRQRQRRCDWRGVAFPHRRVRREVPWIRSR